MDDLIVEFLTETNESLSLLDSEIVKLEQDPNNKEILSNIFRVMHTIKGTCGFLGLPRLEKVAHSAENVLGKIREGAFVANQSIISLILEAIDRIKLIIENIEKSGTEPEGDDTELKERLNKCADTGQASGGIAVASAAPEINIVFEPKKSELIVKERPADEISSEAKAEAIAEGLKAAEKAENKTTNNPANDGNQTIRVNLSLLENLMQMVSELVLTRNQILQISRTMEGTPLVPPLQRLNHITTDLQEGVMKTRMQPIGNAWSKFPRLIRDLSVELSKKVDLKLVGEDTEIDRQLLEVIKDPLTHMVRNSMDHGIESPADRKAAGKSETGTITLSAYHEGGHIIIKIVDDGKGINVERIKQKAIEKNLASSSEIANMSNQQIYQFIFAPGFSTAQQVTAVSGRGVGMDVVKTNIEKVGGHVELNSEFGKGSSFTIKIPLTLAIMPVLIVECRSEKYAMPQIRITEIVKASFPGKNNSGKNNLDSKVEIINDSPVLRLRGKLLPLISLAKILKIDSSNFSYDLDKDNFVVVCQIGGISYGLIVDKVFHTEEIVVKPVSPPLKSIEVYSGTTILGDGSVIMILDANGIYKAIGGHTIGGDKESEEDAKKTNKTDTVGFLVFKAGGKSPKAVPLELVARLEEIDLSKKEWAGENQVVQYRNDLMRLVVLDDEKPVPDSGIQTAIVFSDEGRVMGVLIDEIIDIVEQEMNVKNVGEKEGMFGSMVINDKSTDLIDVSSLFSKYFSDWLEGQIELKQKSTTQKQVLLVDDSPFFRKFMVPILLVADLKVTTCDSAMKALEMLEKENKYDLIITDIDMPQMNGIEFVQKLKSIEKFNKIPVIALTSYTSNDFLSNTKELGFSGYVSKSDRDNLTLKINEVFNNSEEKVSQ